MDGIIIPQQINRIMNLIKLKQFLKNLDDRIFYQVLGRILTSCKPDTLSSISLDISSKCNLKCKMCSLEKWYPKERSKTMSLDTIMTLKSVLPYVTHVSLQCNCEPLLNKDIIGIIEWIMNQNNNIEISMVTNGTLLNKALCTGLLKSGIKKICISLDGATARTYENIRRGSNFQTVINNIKELIFQKDSSINSNLINIELIAVAMKENLHELTDILRLANDFNINTLTINGLEPYTEEMVSQVLYSPKPSEKYEHIFKTLESDAKNYNLNINLPQLKIQDYHFCHLSGVVISSDGTVHPCAPLSYKRPYFYTDGRRLEHPEICFGNVNEIPIMDIWNSIEYRIFRHRLRIGMFPRFCKHCLLKNQVICP